MALISFIYDSVASVEPWVRQGQGRPVYGTAFSVSCRISGKRSKVATNVNTSGSTLETSEAVGNWLMFCDYQYANQITVGSRVTCNGVTYTVLLVRPAKWFMGEHTEVVMV